MQATKERRQPFRTETGEVAPTSEPSIIIKLGVDVVAKIKRIA